MRVCVQVEMSSSMVQGLVSSGSGPLALENPPFLGPDPGAQGRLEKRQKQLPTWQSSQMNYLAGLHRDGVGDVGRGCKSLYPLRLGREGVVHSRGD